MLLRRWRALVQVLLVGARRRRDGVVVAGIGSGRGGTKAMMRPAQLTRTARPPSRPTRTTGDTWHRPWHRFIRHGRWKWCRRPTLGNPGQRCSCGAAPLIAHALCREDAERRLSRADGTGYQHRKRPHLHRLSPKRTCHATTPVVGASMRSRTTPPEPTNSTRPRELRAERAR